MKAKDDSEFLAVPDFRSSLVTIMVDKDDLLDLLRERQLLREALTSAQDRCGRLNEERAELKRRIGIDETVMNAVSAECRRLSDENRELRGNVEVDESVPEAFAPELSWRDDTDFDHEGGTGTLDPSDR